MKYHNFDDNAINKNKTWVVYSKDNCPHCTRALSMLNNRKLPIIEWKLDEDFTIEYFLSIVPAGVRTFPQIYIGKTYVGGADQLVTYLSEMEDND
jgi:Glutaredoxin and related proteins